MDELTPVENRNGLLYKREDLYAEPIYGINGAKFRAARYLMHRARSRGIQHVVTGAPVDAPTLAIVSYAAMEAGLRCSILVGTRTVENALAHRSCRLASECGADVVALGRGMYMPMLQRQIREFCAERPGSLALEHGITVPDDAPADQIEAFLTVGARGVENLSEATETLVVPLGGGNSAAGVLYGLANTAPPRLHRVVLVGIGPDRLDWLRDRLASVGHSLVPEGVSLEYLQTYPEWASYPDRIRYSQDGIAFHPTYEGKAVSYLDHEAPAWWTSRNGTTCFWIIGGQF